MTINEMVEQAHKNSRAKGWWDEQTLPDNTLVVTEVKRSIPEKLALIHSEVSEALEEYRLGNNDLLKSAYEKGKPVSFKFELADILIRVGDLAGALGLDLESAVKEKMAYNATRPHRHGGKIC